MFCFSASELSCFVAWLARTRSLAFTQLSRGTGTPPPVLCAQGIDIKSGGRYIGHKNRTAPKSENVYINLLHKVSQALKKHRFRTN